MNRDSSLRALFPLLIWLWCCSNAPTDSREDAGCVCRDDQYCCLGSCQDLGTSCGSADSGLDGGDIDGGGEDAGAIDGSLDGGVTCVPLDATQARCDAGDVLSCGSDGRMIREACPSATRCIEFVVEDRRASDGVLIRSIPWAACVDNSSSSCVRRLVLDDGDPRWEGDRAGCEGNDQVSICGSVDLPAGQGPEVLRGTTAGVRTREPCRDDETCEVIAGRVDCVLDESDCVDAVSDYCQDSGTLVRCGPPRRRACRSGYVCGARSDGVGACRPADADTCDPATFVDECVTDVESRSCYPPTGTVITTDCNAFACYDPLTGAHSAEPPCRCTGTGGNSISCVQSSLPSCNPGSTESRCIGDVVERCLPVGDGVLVRQDCASLGLTCRVGDGGVPGCASADAECPWYACDGDVLTSCCLPDGYSPSGANNRGFFLCAPGLPTRFDCTTVSPHYVYRCDTSDGCR